ncbi:MAG: hypothetical protein QM773_03655 [Hyphomonadaceae bacterium]
MDGFEADDFVDAVLNDDGTAVRVLFKQDGNTFYFQVPTAALAAFMPTLTKAAKAASSNDERLSITAKKTTVEMANNGDVLVTITNTANGEFTYDLNWQRANVLHAELGMILGIQGESSEQH